MNELRIPPIPLPSAKVLWHAIPLLLVVGLIVHGSFGGGVPSILTPAGPRDVVILEETEQRTPEYAKTFIDLATHQVSKEHNIQILDDDLSSPIVEKLKGVTAERPAIFISVSDRLLYSGKCPAGVEAVNALIREH